MQEIQDAITDLNGSDLCVTRGEAVDSVAEIAVADSDKAPVIITATGFGYDTYTEAHDVAAIDSTTR